MEFLTGVGILIVAICNVCAIFTTTYMMDNRRYSVALIVVSLIGFVCTILTFITSIMIEWSIKLTDTKLFDLLFKTYPLKKKK